MQRCSCTDGRNVRNSIYQVVTRLSYSLESLPALNVFCPLDFINQDRNVGARLMHMPQVNLQMFGGAPDKRRPSSGSRQKQMMLHVIDVLSYCAAEGGGGLNR